MSQITINHIAALAWNLVKSPSDPTFNQCSIDHKEKYIYHAMSVRNSGIANDAFELKVKEILVDPEGFLAKLNASLSAPPVAEVVSNDAPASDDDKVEKVTKAKPEKAKAKKDK